MKRSWILLIFVLQVILYWKGLKGGFVFDDPFLIVDTLGTLNLWEIWTRGLWATEAEQVNFYRPIFSTSIWLDQQFFGLNPEGYHWHSLFWHGLNLLLMAKLCAKILPTAQQIVALLIFASHPLLSESVFWIAARNDLMALTFILLFLNAFWGENRRFEGFPDRLQALEPRRIALLAGLFFAALLSKEVALILMIPVLASLKTHRAVKTLLLLQLGLVAVIFLWRHQLGIDPPAFDGELAQLAAQQSGAFLVDGLGRLGFPWRLSPASSLQWLHVEFSHLALAIGVVAYLAWRCIRDKSNLWWVLSLLGSVLVALPVVIQTGNTGDRYWTVAVMIWSILLAQSLPRKWFWIPLPFWMVMIFLRGSAWESERHFWTIEKSMNPNPYTAVSLAIVDYNEQQYEAALEGFYEGYSAEPPYLRGCDSFVFSVLAVKGAEAALQANDWLLSRGCPEDAALKGLRALLLVQLGRWDAAAAVVAAEDTTIDSSLMLVKILLDWRGGHLEDFCQGLESWPLAERSNLEAQLKALSSTDFQAMQSESCFMELRE